MNSPRHLDPSGSKPGSVSDSENENRASGDEASGKISSETVIQRILDTSQPAQLVGKLAEEDFFWLVLDAESDSSLEILRLASEDQWTYLQDLLIWNNEGLDIDAAVDCFERLYQADSGRLATRLLYLNPTLLSLFLSRTVRLWIREHDEPMDLSGKEWFTLDEVFYIRCRRRKHRVFIGELLSCLAESDFDRYHAVMTATAEIIPAEEEEELWRLRNARLADKGFAPWEEAMMIYSYIKPDQLDRKLRPLEYFSDSEEESEEAVPMTPALLVESDDAFSRALSAISGPSTVDRLRLEFAGLCNMALSVEGRIPDDSSLLRQVYRKASGMVSIGIERTDGESSAILQENSLHELFRLGYSAVLELQWKVKNWWERSWVRTQGLPLSFWDQPWQGLLEGLYRKRPLRYDAGSESRPFVDFKSLEEIRSFDEQVETLEALDIFLEASCKRPIPDDDKKDALFTWKRCLYTIWARSSLGLGPALSALDSSDLSRFFDRMSEAGADRSAWTGKEVMEAFFDVLETHTPRMCSDHWRILRAVYRELLETARKEFAGVKREDLDARYVDLFWVLPGPEEEPS